jgi:hypothetical protein
MPETLATIFNSVTVVLLALLGAVEISKKPNASERLIKKSLWTGLTLSVVLSLIFQYWASVHLHTYKSDMILRFEDKFDEKLLRERAEAATAISEYLKTRNWVVVTNDYELASLEDVLGFFDELGFYWKNGEVSEDVLYEHFYDSMRTYCQETEGYIRKEQAKDSITDWEYVKPMFVELTKMEVKKTGRSQADCVWTTNMLQNSLQSEMRLIRK